MASERRALRVLVPSRLSGRGDSLAGRPSCPAAGRRANGGKGLGTVQWRLASTPAWRVRPSQGVVRRGPGASPQRQRSCGPGNGARAPGGRVIWEAGDAAAGRASLEDALALARHSGDHRPITYALYVLALVASAQGDYGCARRLQEEHLAISRGLDNQQWIASGLMRLAHVATAQSEFATAQALYLESLSVRNVVGMQLGLALTLAGVRQSGGCPGAPATGTATRGRRRARVRGGGVPHSPVEAERGRNPPRRVS